MRHLSSISLALLTILATSSTFALNNLHFARLQSRLTPFVKSGKTNYGIGVRSKFEGDINIPLYITHGLSKGFEAGTKVEISSNDDFDRKNLNIGMTLMMAGLMKNGGRLQTDILLNLSKSAPEGAVITYEKSRRFDKSLVIGWNLRGAFLNLADKEITVLETGLYPKFNLSKSFAVTGDIVYSNSPTSPTDYGSFDAAPGIELNAGGTRFYGLAWFGLAGKRQETKILWEMGVISGF